MRYAHTQVSAITRTGPRKGGADGMARQSVQFICSQPRCRPHFGSGRHGPATVWASDVKMPFKQPRRAYRHKAYARYTGRPPSRTKKRNYPHIARFTSGSGRTRRRVMSLRICRRVIEGLGESFKNCCINFEDGPEPTRCPAARYSKTSHLYQRGYSKGTRASR